MGDQKIKYLYILSQRYSGSTLLSFLIATHPEVSTVGERRKIWNKVFQSEDHIRGYPYQCSCGQLAVNCPYYNQIKNAVIGRLGQVKNDLNYSAFEMHRNRKLNFVASRVLRHILPKKSSFFQQFYRSRLRKAWQFNQVFVEEMLKLDGSKYFLDSSKHNSHLYFLSKIERFDIKVIWLVRDPRGQINSSLKKHKSWPLTRHCDIWTKEMRENASALKKLNLDYMQIQYEHLCENPGKSLDDIFNFAGIDPKPASLDFRAHTQHIIGNAMMRLGDESEIRVRQDWKEQLSPEQIRTIESMTGDYRQFYFD